MNTLPLADTIVNVMAAAENQAKSMMREDDYTVDGIIYCGKCGRARQTWIEFFGKPMLVWCICDCRMQELNDMDTERTRNTIQSLKERGFCDRALADNTFDLDENPDSMESTMCRNYVEHFENFYERGKGLILTGGVGTGKTYYASCIANALMDKLHPVLVTSIGRMVREMEADYGGRNEAIDALNRYALVVFDDLGVERNTPYMNELLYSIIDSRIRSGKPMVITTNIPVGELKQPTNIDYARIYDRILSACVPIVFHGENMRRKQLKETYADDLALLKGVG